MFVKWSVKGACFLDIKVRLSVEDKIDETKKAENFYQNNQEYDLIE